MVRKLLIVLAGTATVVVATIVVANLMPFAGRPRLPQRPPNIVVVVADDWSYPHASAYGGPMRTPAFDIIAAQGVLFTHAFSPSPSCTSSRFATLTGQRPHRLGAGGNLMSKIPLMDVYPALLEQAGYFVGSMWKGCAPGSTEEWAVEPAGETFVMFDSFLDALPEGKPFCFWQGSPHPHRPYKEGMGDIMNLKKDEVVVPAYLPDTDVVRGDFTDYESEIRMLDNELGNVYRSLEARDLLDNTIIVVFGDNGMPFPRAKGTCYDGGCRVPMAIRWGDAIPAGNVFDGLVNLCDLAPTFLEAAGVVVPADMTGRSLLGVMTTDWSSRWRRWLGKLRFRDDPFQQTFVERERHSLGRGINAQGVGHLSYPVRGVRTHEFLYLRNFRPGLWPAGDPPKFGDMDASPSREEVLATRNSTDPLVRRYFDLSFAKRPPEELYDLRNDPDQIHNLANDYRYDDDRQRLARTLEEWMRTNGDPRVDGEDDRWDYYGWYEPNGRKILFERGAIDAK